MGQTTSMDFGLKDTGKASFWTFRKRKTVVKWPNEQMDCRRQNWGTKDQLMTVKMVIKTAKEELQT